MPDEIDDNDCNDIESLHREIGALKRRIELLEDDRERLVLLNHESIVQRNEARKAFCWAEHFRLEEHAARLKRENQPVVFCVLSPWDIASNRGWKGLDL